MTTFTIHGTTFNTTDFTSDFSLVAPVTVDGVSLPRWAALHYAGAQAMADAADGLSAATTLAPVASEIVVLTSVMDDIQTLAALEDGTTATGVLTALGPVAAEIQALGVIVPDVQACAAAITDIQAAPQAAADAATARDAAQASQTAAAGSATAASDSATAAAGSQTAAAGSATAASASATAASDSATAASGSATAADASATAAATAQGAAETARHAAAGSATAADASATAASASATAASGSATDAADSAQQAHDWASQAQAVAGGGIIPTGSVWMYAGATTPAGWLLLGGGTIGPAGSGATARADADAEALYLLLWHAMADAEAPVTGGRGASAADDWAAAKPITMPDMRGRMGIGSGAGSGLTARTHGGTGGAETHTLSTGQLPPHDHPLEIVPGAGTGTTEPQAGTSYYLGGVGGRADGGPYTAVSPDPTTTVEGSRIVGAGDPVPHMPPFLAMNWIIKL